MVRSFFIPNILRNFSFSFTKEDDNVLDVLDSRILRGVWRANSVTDSPFEDADSGGGFFSECTICVESEEFKERI